MTDRPQPKKSSAAPSPKREWRVRSTGEALLKLFEHMGGRHQPRLVQLWRHWDMVLGEYLASLGRPLGHKEGTLLIGAEDTMAMQELSMQSVEILERVNAFMAEGFFEKIKVELMQQRQDLARPKAAAPTSAWADTPHTEPLYPAAPIGAHLGSMKPDSPVARCYEAWVKRLK